MEGRAGEAGPQGGDIVASGKKVWVGWIVSILPSLMFVFSGLMKLKGGPELAKGFEHLGLPEQMAFPLAILELTCIAIYLIPPTAVLGGILMAGFLGGAICTH